MSYRAAVDILQPAVNQATSVLTKIYIDLDSLCKLDLSTGNVDVNEKHLYNYLISTFGEEAGKHYFDDFQELTKDEFVVFRGRDQEGVKPFPVPWSLVKRSVQGRGKPARGLLTFPIHSDDARQALQKRFPNIPAELLEDETLSRLIILPRIGGDGPDIDVPDDTTDDSSPNSGGGQISPPSWDRTTTVFGDTDISNAEIEKFVNCIFNPANWRFHWWGWEVCLDEECANVVANFLLPGNFGSMKNTLGIVLKNSGIDIPFITFDVASFALTVYGILLAINILAVNGQKGVCIQSNWPTPWVGMFIWAIGR